MAETNRTPRTSQQDAIRRVRQSLDDAITLQAGDDIAWASNLVAVLRKLARVFDRHVKEAEAPDGSLQEILALKPQLSRQVRQILDEHLKLREEIAELELGLNGQVSSGRIDVESIRLRAGQLNDTVRLHQAKGADLVFEAYHRVEGGQG